MTFMNLAERSEENLTYMVEQMVDKLQIVNRGIIKAENFNIEEYEQIKELHDLIMSKPSLSVSEIQAIVGELGQLRKK